jgi:hypothetical protein
MAVFAVTEGHMRGARKPWNCSGGAVDNFFKERVGIVDAEERIRCFSMVCHSPCLTKDDADHLDHQIVSEIHSKRKEYFPQLKQSMDMYLPDSNRKKAMMLDISALLNKETSGQLKKFVRQYGNEILTTPNASRGILVLPPASKLIRDQCTMNFSPREITAFESLHTVLRHTSMKWMVLDKSKTISNAFIKFCIYHGMMVKQRKLMFQNEMMMTFRKGLEAVLVRILNRNGHERESFPWCDKITKLTPITSASELADIMPAPHDAETLSIASARALAAPESASSSQRTIAKIIHMVTAEGLGGLSIDGHTKVDPKFKASLIDFLEASVLLAY